MVGSGVLARELREQQQQLRLVVSLEMLGYTSERQHYPLDTMRAIYRDRGTSSPWSAIWVRRRCCCRLLRA